MPRRVAKGRRRPGPRSREVRTLRRLLSGPPQAPRVEGLPGVIRTSQRAVARPPVWSWPTTQELWEPYWRHSFLPSTGLL
jgi:hypothetical protein